MTRLTLTQLKNTHIKQSINHYGYSVIEYARKSDFISKQLRKIIFQSEREKGRKIDTALQKFATAFGHKLKKLKWKIKYQLDIEHKHTITFTKDRVQQVSMPIIVDADQRHQIQKWGTKPVFFMQVTSITIDYFHVELSSTDQMDRMLQIKNVQHEDDSKQIQINKRISFTANVETKHFDVDIDTKYNEIYNLAIYDADDDKQPLSNTNSLQIILNKDKFEYPLQNINYKPNVVKLSTIFQVKDVENDLVYFYWSVPSKSFGEISYKIIENENEEYNIITSLPYSINSLSECIFFTITTRCTIDGIVYESDATAPIFLESKLSNKPIHVVSRSMDHKRNNPMFYNESNDISIIDEDKFHELQEQNQKQENEIAVLRKQLELMKTKNRQLEMKKNKQITEVEEQRNKLQEQVGQIHKTIKEINDYYHEIQE
eukprot:316464_1